MNDELKKRVLSFLWRLAGTSLVALVAFLADNLTLLHIPVAFVGLAALLLNECTKYLNNRFALGARVLGAFRKK